MSVVSSDTTSLIRSPAPYASMKIARYLSEVVASRRRLTSEPLKISGECRRTLAGRISLHGSRPSHARSANRIAAKLTLRVRGLRSRWTMSSRYCSTSLLLTARAACPPSR